MATTGCGCDRGASSDRLPSKHLVAYDAYWSVVHAYGSGLLGWLIIAPRRHVMELSELTDDEAASLGVWQVRLARALAAELGRPKTYVARFGEAAGYHLHFHVIARPPELADERVGPGVFGFLGPGERDRVSDADRDELAARLAARLRRER